MLLQTFRQEGARTVGARLQSFCVVGIKGLLVILVQIITFLSRACQSSIKIFRWLRTRSSLVLRLLCLLVIPLLPTCFQVNLETGGAEFAPTDVTHQRTWLLQLRQTGILFILAAHSLLSSTSEIRLSHATVHCTLFLRRLRTPPYHLLRALASFLVTDKTIRQKGPSTAIARHESICVERFERVLIDSIICTGITRLDTCKSSIELSGFGRYWSPFMLRLLCLHLFPLGDTLRNMNVNTCSSVLLPTYIADNCFWSLIKAHFLLIIDIAE